jgi:hypothetical protein
VGHSLAEQRCGSQDSRSGASFFPLCLVVAVLSAGLLAYSETIAFTWDEGFHLLAAQLIGAGKRPYLDFFHPQTPLYAYWNAAWMRVFGESWRVAHALSALLTAGAAMLMADFAFARFQGHGWQLAGGFTATFLVLLNPLIVRYGTIGQPYGLCLFLIVAAFRLAVAAVDRKPLLVPAGAGLFAGAAAASSLLTAPVGPVLLFWMLAHDRTGNRLPKSAVFLAGAAVPFLPLLWLFAHAPRQVLFQAIAYHLLYRRVDWPNATEWDLGVLASWMESSHAMLLLLLAGLGLLSIAGKNCWDPRRRAEFSLCGWLAAALGAYLACAHPTFHRYFVFVVPFLSALAAAGLFAIASRIDTPGRPFRLMSVLAALLALGLAKSLYEARDVYRWRDLEEVAGKVNEVTPAGGSLFADEHIYFLTRRPPPSGMEYADTHKLDVDAAFAASVHIVPQPELERRIAAGTFSTVSLCEEPEKIQALGLPRIYARQAEIKDCRVFWDRVKR